METSSIFFLVLVSFAAMVQTVTGFAMGLIIIGGVTAFGLADIHVAAAVVSLISLVNATVALRTTHKFVDWQLVKWITVGLLPMVLLGVGLLELLSASSSVLLGKLLGAVIVTAGVLLMITPKPFQQPSGRFARVVAGAVGGLMGGMYGAGGAPIAYFLYRQPFDILKIRATLLGVFAVSTILRSVAITIAGQIDEEVVTLTVMSIPVVVVVTLFMSRIAHRLPDMLIRRAIFILLIAIGCFLILN